MILIHTITVKASEIPDHLPAGHADFDVRITEDAVRGMMKDEPKVLGWKKIYSRMADLEEASWVLMYVRCRLAGKTKDAYGMATLLHRSYVWVRSWVKLGHPSGKTKTFLSCMAAEVFLETGSTRENLDIAEEFLIEYGASPDATVEAFDGICRLSKDLGRPREGGGE